MKVRLAELERSRAKLAKARNNETERFHPKDFITMTTTTVDVRDFNKIFKDKGVYLCAFSPVAPDKLQVKAEITWASLRDSGWEQWEGANAQTLKCNSALSEATIRTIPHLTNGKTANKSVGVWMHGGGAPGAFAFGQRHGAGCYPLTEKGFVGHLYFIFQDGEEKMYVRFKQFRIPGSNGGQMGIPACHALLTKFDCKVNESFVKYDMCVKFEVVGDDGSFENCKFTILELRGVKDLNIDLNKGLEELNVYATLSGVYFK